MTNVVFDNIEANIVNQLMLTQKSIKVAVAWINSKDILGILCWKLKGGVDVVLVLQYDDINNGGRNSLDFSEYKKLGGKLYWVEEMNSTMHTKCCIIDNKILLHGSCNWTYRGFNKNVEAFNMTYDEPSLIEEYSVHFERIKVGTRRGASVFAEKVPRRRKCRGWRTRHGASLPGECVNPRVGFPGKRRSIGLTQFSWQTNHV